MRVGMCVCERVVVVAWVWVVCWLRAGGCVCVRDRNWVGRQLRRVLRVEVGVGRVIRGGGGGVLGWVGGVHGGGGGGGRGALEEGFRVVA